MCATAPSPRPAGTTSYDARFDAAGWYLIRGVMRAKSTLGRSTPSLIDLGMGRGRDLIYFARRGFRVLGVDLSPVGVAKAHRRAARLKVPIRTEVADLRVYRLPRAFDVVFSSSTLNYLPPSFRARRFAHFQDATVPGGIHAVNAFVAKPRRPPADDLDPGVALYRPGELRSYYRSWQVLDSREFELDCAYGARPHRHALEVVLARRPV